MKLLLRVYPELVEGTLVRSEQLGDVSDQRSLLSFRSSTFSPFTTETLLPCHANKGSICEFCYGKRSHQYYILQRSLNIQFTDPLYLGMTGGEVRNGR